MGNLRGCGASDTLTSAAREQLNDEKTVVWGVGYTTRIAKKLVIRFGWKQLAKPEPAGAVFGGR